MLLVVSFAIRLLSGTKDVRVVVPILSLLAGGISLELFSGVCLFVPFLCAVHLQSIKVSSGGVSCFGVIL